MSDRTFIDTNIFLYCHDTSNPAKADAAKNIVFENVKSGNCAVSTQVLAEFFQNAVVKFSMPYIDVIKELHFMSRCKVIEQDIALVVSAASLYRRLSLSFWDTMIVAAALKASADILYTEDMRHGQEIEGTKIVNPFI